jgi:hypothetical protein
VLIRPSLDLHLRWLWESDPSHHEFWELTLAIAARPDITEIATLVGTGIAAEMAETVEDVAPVINAITGADGNQQAVGERVLAYTFRFGADAGPAAGGRRRRPVDGGGCPPE